MKVSYQFKSEIDKLISGCFKDIDTYVNQDIQDSAFQEGMTRLDAANKIRDRLESRYFWTKWLVIVSEPARGQEDRYPTKAEFPKGRGYWFDPVKANSEKKRSVVAVPLPSTSCITASHSNPGSEIVSKVVTDCDSARYKSDRYRPDYCGQLGNIINPIRQTLVNR